jgi:ubiquinone/menaquinone biosynthesis C-methylase UbiE
MEPRPSGGNDTTELPEWDGAAYAANTAHHRVHDDRFLAPLALRGDEHVLDIGCGSGDFTARVAALVPRGRVVGVDPQRSLLEEAERVAGPNQEFVQGTAQGLVDHPVLATERGFDVVISRAALHWVPKADHPAVLAAAHSLLAPGGRLRLEFGGHGNIAPTMAALDEWSAALGGPRSPWYFPGPGEYLGLLERAGFEVEPNDVLTVAQRRPFDHDGLWGWFSSQVEQAYTHTMAPDAAAELRSTVQANLDVFCHWDGTYDQTYVRLEASARRPAAPGGGDER